MSTNYLNIFMYWCKRLSKRTAFKLHYGFSKLLIYTCNEEDKYQIVPKKNRALPQWKKLEDLDMIFLIEQLQPNENLQHIASLTPMQQPDINSITIEDPAVHWAHTVVKQ
ncbi:hypothetical protein T4D_16512 [Trichinella pseudospiralis]|uniref:Uncharacterized protein n=1 Tax=Trichinella pseudospiralis TaxID=6337 RepID=A0A0V1FKC8_TRIPS|nr:hypothetical protein T4D_10306 [Trichinella pseudospiralis]KRY85731.1 hypothetical protein T4D_16512 [Trichinella pseudospiralis]